MKRRDFLAHTGAGAVLASVGRTAAAADPGAAFPAGPSPLIAWNQALTAAIAASSHPPTVAARALSMVYEAVYNAWAAYGNIAAFTLPLPGLRYRPRAEWKTANKAIAVGYAAYGVLVDLYPDPARRKTFDDALTQTLAGLQLGTQEAVAAMQLGTAAAVALLQARWPDGSNQRGDLAPGSYADWTGYAPVNGLYSVVNPPPWPYKVDYPLRWRPLQVVSAQGVASDQHFVTPHWGRVRSFSLSSGDVFRPAFISPLGASVAEMNQLIVEMNQLIAFSAGLNDATKAQVDFFANNPGSVTPPGQWSKFAELVSANDGNTLDQDVVLFFVLGQAMLDASIACWEAKRFYDSARPVTAIRYFYGGQTLQAWGGLGSGTQAIPGENWLPYQRPTVPSPAFPEFCSGHSTFSAAAAACIAALRGSDSISLAFTFPAGGIPFDPTVPAAPVVLRWSSLSALADAAGLSRRLGGIHFEQGDLKGRALGRQVAQAVLAKCLTLVRVAARRD